MFLINTEGLKALPLETHKDFKSWIESGETPSAALNKFIAKYKLDSEYRDVFSPVIILRLLELTYPDIQLELEAFRSRLVDSGYPFVSDEDMNDELFDEIIKRIKDAPPSW